MPEPKISRSRHRGYHAEVELVDGIRRFGGEALRVAGSGHKTKLDVLASIPIGGAKRMFAFEVKASEKESVAVPADRVRALREFCRGFAQGESGPIPIVAVKWVGKRRGWSFRQASGEMGLAIKWRAPRTLLQELKDSLGLGGPSAGGAGNRSSRGRGAFRRPRSPASPRARLRARGAPSARP